MPPLSNASHSLSFRATERRLAWVNPISNMPVGEETLGPIRLEKDVPIYGIVNDQTGQPVAGVKFFGAVDETISDAAGKFVVRGFGPEARFQMLARKDGHEPGNWGVSVKKDGIYWHDVGDRTEHGPNKELTLRMKSVPKAWIEGRAV